MIIRYLAQRVVRELAHRLGLGFHNMSYEKRVRAIKKSYAQARMKYSFDQYFASMLETPSIASVQSPFYDLISSYAHLLHPNSVHQVGCFTAMESRWLIDRGFRGNIIASDFDPQRIEYLAQQFALTPYEHIQLRVLDLESRQYEILRDINMLVAYAVFSNLQPETVDHFFSQIGPLGIHLLVIRDVITKNSLTKDPENTTSLRSMSDNNWYHRYLALAAKYGIEAFVLPEFIPVREAHVSCLFVFHRDIQGRDHERVIGDAFGSYLERQDAMLSMLARANR